MFDTFFLTDYASFPRQALTGKLRFAIEPHRMFFMRLSIFFALQKYDNGQVAEWLKAADCKSALVRVHRFESYPVHHYSKKIAQTRGFRKKPFLPALFW